MPLLIPKVGLLYGSSGIVSETHFGFGFPNGSPVGDSLRAAPTMSYELDLSILCHILIEERSCDVAM